MSKPRHYSPEEKQTSPSSEDSGWDRNQGTPKDPNMAKTVERASSRYSASEQSEKRRSRESEDKKPKSKMGPPGS